VEENDEFTSRKVVCMHDGITVKVKPIHHQIVSVISTGTYIHLGARDGPVLEFRLWRSRSRRNRDLEKLDLL